MGNTDYWNEAIKHIYRRDPILSRIVEAYPEPRLNPHGNVVRTLIKSIVGQQISVQAADATWGRMVGLLGKVEPGRIYETDIMSLRGCGLSMRKAEYISGIAEMWKRGALDVSWDELKESEVKERLLPIRGVGPWTVDMVLIFSLGFQDVLPLGDVGLLRAVENHYSSGKKLTLEEVRRIADPWRPYRTVATWYLWRTIDAEPVNY
ncbi:MAG: DNA-3-methyladenine glycosylase 2 family protein [Candidatus Thermoplasmatota archaeon]|nr:DNA-3-methyladenine glycosylase 2 family protein [Candidatus Thermoplasmatota archaeon]MED5302792.1 DNA-3-methyladenine glycosylase 2 family protein [Candidatus Thermoplasmatota archaeon]|tara:strand:- start:321 stop:938 length:618 start_codon:yes stop_codon:yes gene_type:complete